MVCKWLDDNGHARMKAQSDAEQASEHLLKAVKSWCALAQRAPLKSHASQGHVDRAVRLIVNQHRAVQLDRKRKTPRSLFFKMFSFGVVTKTPHQQIVVKLIDGSYSRLPPSW